MTPELKWLDEPQISRINTMAAHSDHIAYLTEQEMDREMSGLRYVLDGQWEFHYAPCPQQRPENFYLPDKPCDNFTAIQVPGHIELAGFSQIHYINTPYPWEGREYRRPQDACREHPHGVGNFSRAEDNAVGSYRCRFDLPDNMRGKRLSVLFGGIEQAAYVWLNGHFLGYTEDSFSPAEFDLTDYIKEQGNLLAVQVYRYSTAAYLEDQDFFRFFGIFRSVTLIARPPIHVEDMDVRPVLFADGKSGAINCTMSISGDISGYYHAELKDPNGNMVAGQQGKLMRSTLFSFSGLDELLPWDCCHPNLYRLIIRIYDRQNQLTEIIPQMLGFRRLEIQNGVIMLNDHRLCICGINRHEWSPESGRVITCAEMQKDIKIIKSLNINAVRTSHYPNALKWYDMCDCAGLYVMAETNLESHGSWQKTGKIEPSWNIPGSSKLWTAAVLERGQNQYQWLKNHPSILFWSLGNESYIGDNLKQLNQFYHDQHDGRLTHYEGVYLDRRYENTVSDVESRMYAPPEQIEEYLTNNPMKPFILCEYMHSMGNSVGGLQEYISLMERYPMFQGGFIWDYIDQALYQFDSVTGKKVLRYGGDFDDRPTDYEFSADGILFADRTEKPAAQEVRYFYGKFAKA